MNSTNDQSVKDLWDAYFSEASVLHRNRLFHHYSLWLRKIVSGFYLKSDNSLLQWSDYMQNAAIALIETIENFDGGRGVPFEGYAYARIKGALLNTYNKERSTNKRLDVADEEECLLDENEISDEINFDAFVDSVIGVAFSQLLDLASDRISGFSANPLDLQLLYSEEKMVMGAVDKLDENLRFIIIAHYQHYISFKEIAETLDLSRSRVSQLHAEAIKKLRNFYEEN